jgi:hypothetical protein
LALGHRLYNFALAVAKSGDYHRAHGLFRQALETMQETLPSSHSLVTSAQELLCNIEKILALPKKKKGR